MNLQEDIAKIPKESIFFNFIFCKECRDRVETLDFFPIMMSQRGGIMLVPMEYEVPIIVLEDPTNENLSHTKCFMSDLSL